jgi:hypothetical protein
MKKLKLRMLTDQGQILTREQLKMVSGGNEDPGSNGAGCYNCHCESMGYSSCWYTSNPYTLCIRVYPNCPGPVTGARRSDCNGCVMN